MRLARRTRRGFGSDPVPFFSWRAVFVLVPSQDLMPWLPALHANLVPVLRCCAQLHRVVGPVPACSPAARARLDASCLVRARALMSMPCFVSARQLLHDAEADKGTSLTFSDSDSDHVSEHSSPAAGKKSVARNGAGGRGARPGQGGSGGYASEEERFEEERSRRERCGSDSPVPSGRARARAETRYLGGPMGHNPRGGEGRSVDHDLHTPGSKGKRGGQIVSDHKLVLCPICFEYLLKNFGQEPGQKFAPDPNPDPLASVMR